MFITLVESGFNRGLGFEVIEKAMGIRKDAYWFGEAQGRVVVSVDHTNKHALVDLLQSMNIPFSEIGKVTANELIVDNENWGRIHEWKEKYDNAITNLLKGEAAESALSAI